MLNTEKKAATSNELTDVHVLITVSPEGDGNKYRVYLDQHITYAKEYRNLVEFLATATGSDVFELILNGPGGHLTSCVQLIHAIANTEAKVIGHCVGDIASAHSNIFMACHEHVVYPYSCMMVHTFSGGTYGKGEDLVRCGEAWNAQTKLLYTDLYSDFLTEEELHMVLHGNNDRYFIGQDIVDRLSKVYSARHEALQDAIAEAKLREEDEVLEQALAIMESRGALNTQPDIQINTTGEIDVLNTMVDTFTEAVEENLAFEDEEYTQGHSDADVSPEDLEEDEGGLGSSIAGSLGIPIEEDED